jgi:hypothetical protein
MGVVYMAANRANSKDLGGRELSLSELRALRYVREHRKNNPVPREQLLELDGEIRRLETVKILEDYEYLAAANRRVLVRLEKPSARLSYDERLGLTAWVDLVEKIRRDHRDIFHIGQLLTVGDGGDGVLRNLNLGYLHLAVLGHPANYRDRGLLSVDWDRPTEHLQRAIEGLTAGLLGQHLEDGRWFGPPRRLAALPEDRVRRAQVLALYQDYLELVCVANAYGDFGAGLLPVVEGGPRLLSRAEFRLEHDASGWFRDTLEQLAQHLEAHLRTRGGEQE